MDVAWFYSSLYNNLILGMKLSPLAMLSAANLFVYTTKKRDNKICSRNPTLKSYEVFFSSYNSKEAVKYKMNRYLMGARIIVVAQRKYQ